MGWGLQSDGGEGGVLQSGTYQLFWCFPSNLASKCSTTQTLSLQILMDRESDAKFTDTDSICRSHIYFVMRLPHCVIVHSDAGFVLTWV